MVKADPPQHFSGRTADYVRARPSYPEGVLDVLRAECGLSAGKVVADLGAGTGIFTKLLLASGAEVLAVEPNDQMRAECEASLAGATRLRCVAGRAEATTLDDASVDLVTAAQAFHWFDLAKTKVEIRRVLRPGGSIALVWNDRDVESTPFLVAFDELLTTQCAGYRELQGKSDAAAQFDELFGEGRWSRHELANAQELDRDGLVARVMSASYAPKPGTDAHAKLIASLGELFEAHARDGLVEIRYATVLITPSRTT